MRESNLAVATIQQRLYSMLIPTPHFIYLHISGCIHPLHKTIISICHCLIQSIIGGPPITILVISIDHSYPHLVMVQYPRLHKQTSHLWCARLASPHYSALLFRGIFWFFSHDLQCLPLFFGRLMRSVHVDHHHHRELL